MALASPIPQSAMPTESLISPTLRIPFDSIAAEFALATHVEPL
jgi:hypothetical protein